MSNPDLPVSITVDLTTWHRVPELVEYARVRGVSLSEAIDALVCSGLSHQRRLYVPFGKVIK